MAQAVILFVLQQALSFRTRRHLCRLGVSLPSNCNVRTRLQERQRGAAVGNYDLQQQVASITLEPCRNRDDDINAKGRRETGEDVAMGAIQENERCNARVDGADEIVVTKWLILLVTLGNTVMRDEAKRGVPDMHFVPSEHSSGSGKADHSRPCTADELLPRYQDSTNESAVEWAVHDVIEPLYGCDCPFYKASYFCPNLGVGGSFKWVPRAVADGICQEKPLDQLENAPLPPNFRILVYGNSHLRQVIESIMCMFQQSIERKRVVIDDQDVMVPSDTHCRSCSDRSLYRLRMGHDCLPFGVNCTCSDDRGEFIFENGAVIHYVFAHRENDKQIESGLLVHNTSIPYYDVVVANAGNPPCINQSSLLQSAAKIQNEGVQLIWLTGYTGKGDISGWEASEKTQLADTGTMFLPVHYMARGMGQWTKAFVFGGSLRGDKHFCLPGPPDHMGLLMLRIMWAFYDEWGGTRHTVDGEMTKDQDAAP